ncbi:hypothetical protein OPW39_15510 [Vibrio europaeus]|uniref:hypothetical protein n=1 Tax=Vibrio europaeus TaxID=300876 RepID=UPI00233F7130|nr:hypothetical protein [Vibrio europaeus]MDC5870214.1 hypothetical protein [Vibrio europaeus]
MENLIDPKQIEKMLKSNSGRIAIVASPLNPDKRVIEATVHSNDDGEEKAPFVGYMTMKASNDLREYAEEQTAVNALRKMTARVGGKQFDLVLQQ